MTPIRVAALRRLYREGKRLGLGAHPSYFSEK
jgi:hypothetical protein